MFRSRNFSLMMIALLLFQLIAGALPLAVAEGNGDGNGTVHNLKSVTENVYDDDVGDQVRTVGETDETDPDRSDDGDPGFVDSESGDSTDSDEHSTESSTDPKDNDPISYDPISVTEDVYGEDDGPEDSSILPEDDHDQHSVWDDVYGEMNLLMTMMSPLTIDPANPVEEAVPVCSIGDDGIEVCIHSGFSTNQLVLGKEKPVDIIIKNTNKSTDMTDWAYNIGIQLVLEDGLEISALQNPQPTSVEVDAAGTATYYWKDVKNLAPGDPGEEFAFPVTIASLEKFRVEKTDEKDEPISEVTFGEDFEIKVNIYKSNDARTIVGPSQNHDNVSSTVGTKWRIVPFTIIPRQAHKVVKGAGLTDEVEHPEWDQFKFYFDIVNNTKYETKFNKITNTVGGELQVFDIRDGVTNESVVLTDDEFGKREFAWTDIKVGTGATQMLSFNGAFLNHFPSSVTENVYVLDGHWAIGTLTFDVDLLDEFGKPMAQYETLFDDLSGNFKYNIAQAKDIVITKSVDYAGNVGYATELEYTLTVKTNEYYPVHHVIVTDTIGDGQSLKEFTISEVKTGSGSLHAGVLPTVHDVNNSRDTSTGETIFVWDLGTLNSETIVTLKYKTEVDDKWFGEKYGSNASIFAGDSIHNDVLVSGYTNVSGPVYDSDHTFVSIDEPSISEFISLRNAEIINDVEVYATVGDTITFKLEYKAANLNAKQNAVEIRDYLPEGTVPVAWLQHDDYVEDQSYGVSDHFLLDSYIFNYQSDGSLLDSKPYYYPNSNMLVWEFDPIDENSGTLTTEVQVKVLNDPVVKKDKGDQNLVTLTYRNSPSIIASKRSSVKVDFAEPDIQITRLVSRTGDLNDWHETIHVNGKDEVFVKLILLNKSVEASASNSPAYKVVLTENASSDLLDFELIEGDEYLQDGDFTISSGNLIFKLENEIKPNEEIVFVYRAKVMEEIGTGKQIKQSAEAVYVSHPNIDDADPDSGKSYTRTENEQVTMYVGGPSLTYEIIHFGTLDPSSEPIAYDEQDLANVHVGDWIVYKVSVTVPDGDAAYDSNLTVQLSKNHALDEVYSEYNHIAFNGTPADKNDYAIQGDSASGIQLDFKKDKLITNGSNNPYEFYLKTTVLGISSGLSGEQLSSASFSWWDEMEEGAESTITHDPVQIFVTVPELIPMFLDGNKNPYQPITLNKDDEPQTIGFRVVNSGENTAYDFTPVITAPDGYEIVEIVEIIAENVPLNNANNEIADIIVDTNGKFSIQFADPVTLHKKGAGNKGVLDIVFTIRLKEVKGSGSSFEVVGVTGEYYTNQSDVHAVKLKSEAAIAKIIVPDVNLENKIMDTTNDSRKENDVHWIRPGDIVTYELKVTVPDGTQAFDIRVEDTIESPNLFKWFDEEGIKGWTIAWDAKDPNNDPISLNLPNNPIQYDENSGELMINLGDSPDPAIVEADVNYIITFKMRAKEDGTAPKGDLAGSIDGTLIKFNNSSSATVYWKSEDDKDSTELENGPVTTHLEIRQPDLIISANAQTPEYNAENETQTVTFTITNSGKSEAYIPKFMVDFPVGFKLEQMDYNAKAKIYCDYDMENAIDLGEELDCNSDFVTIVWTDLEVPANNHIIVSIDLTVTEMIGAAEEGLQATGVIPHYHSTDAVYMAPTDQNYDSFTDRLTKRYVLDKPDANTLLPIGEVILQAKVIANTNDDSVDGPDTRPVRPGDVLIYEVDVIMPGTTTAHHVILVNDGLINQEIIGVQKDGVTVLPNMEGNYALGTLTADTFIRVVTKVTTNESNISSDSPIVYTPKITYEPVANQGVKSSSASEIKRAIEEANVFVTVEAVPHELEQIDNTSEYTISIYNNGATAAKDVTVTVELLHDNLFNLTGFTDFAGVDYAFGEPQISEQNGTHTYVWTIASLPVDAGGSVLLHFTAQAKPDTAVNTVMKAMATVNEYHSLPSDFEGKLITILNDPNYGFGLLHEVTDLDVLETSKIVTLARLSYGPNVSVEDDVLVKGDHILTDDAEDEVYAGQTAEFDHVLANSGAGQDTYLFELTSDGTDFPGTLYINTEKAADAVWNGGTWIWQNIDDRYNYENGSIPGVTLNAGESANIRLEIHVPEHVRFGDTEYKYELTAKGNLSGNDDGENVSVTDVLTIKGDELDGWTGNQSKDGWKKPTYRQGESLVIQAVTANHIKAVTAEFENIESMDLITLNLMNGAGAEDDPDHYLQTGLKLWEYTTSDSFLNELEAGTYQLTFTAYQIDPENEELDDIEQLVVDAKDKVSNDENDPGFNNSFELIVPNVHFQFSIATDADAGSDDLFTSPTDNRAKLELVVLNEGDSEANQIVVEVHLDEGLYLVENSFSHVPEGDLITPNDDLTGFTWNIDAISDKTNSPENYSHTLMFEVTAPATTHVTDVINVHGNVVSYSTLTGGTGKTYGPLVKQSVPIKIVGSHTLSNDTTNNPFELTAGLDATFEHVLTNTGAGRDTFWLDVKDNPYPLTLSAGDTVIAHGDRDSSDNWVWKSLYVSPENGVVNYNGAPAFVLDSGESITITFDVHVPVTTPHKSTTTFEIIVTGDLSQKEEVVKDTVETTGPTFDGWSGDQVLYDNDGERNATTWIQPHYPRNDAFSLQAISAVHIESVQAAVYLNGTEMMLHTLNVVNKENDQFIQDGYKLWSLVGELPAEFTGGNYDIKFYGFDLQGARVEIDSQEEEGNIAANNPFTIIEPYVSFALQAMSLEDETMTSPEDNISSLRLVVTNNGDSTAHNVEVVVELDPGIVLIPETFSNVPLEDLIIPNEDLTSFTWEIHTIADETTSPGDNSQTLTFKVMAPSTTSVTDAVYVRGHVLTYSSKSGGMGKTYGPLMQQIVPIAVVGAHKLAADTVDNPFKLTAGNEATFEHFLTNTGAGRDTFSFTIANNPYPTKLYIEETEVASGYQNDSGDWTWNSIKPGFGEAVVDANNQPLPSVELDAGARKRIKLVVSVPETVHYGNDHDIAFKLTATGLLSNKHATVTDAVYMIGTDLDGWVSNQLWSQWDKNTYRSEWEEPTYIPHNSVKLSAISAVDATSVKAIIYMLDENGVPTGAAIKEMKLEVINDPDVGGVKKYIQDGYKLWQHVEFTLPKDIAAGRYFTKFEVSYADFINEYDNKTTDLRAEAGYNNYFTVKSSIDLIGIVTDRRTHTPLSGVTVTLLDLDGTVIKTTTTDQNGSYRFEEVTIKNYIIETEEPKYSKYTRTISTVPIHPTDTVVHHDIELIDFVITLQANPSTIVGDGIDATVLTVTITDLTGQPIPFVDVELTAEIGEFTGTVDVPAPPTAGKFDVTTDGEGKAYVVYRSEKIEGLVSQEIPVKVTVDDPIRDLHAEDVIFVTFAPGAIRGTVIDNNTGEPIDQAEVFVYADFDGDGLIDFSARQTTGKDGKYKIAIPLGEVLYTVEITKPVMINGETTHITFTQKSMPDVVDFRDPVVYPSENTATGIILQRNHEQKEDYFAEQVYEKIKIEQIRWNESTGKYEVVKGGYTGKVDPKTGIYTINGLRSDASESLYFRIYREVSGQSGGTEEINLGMIEVIIKDDGDIVIGETLIDPYGIITDAKTGEIIVGAKVELYYADTGRNRQRFADTGENEPHTLVPLPELNNPPFPPANNVNPHYSDETGNYAWMVFPESDYYIIATKEGYHDYNSMDDVGVISVEYEIVEHNFKMVPKDPPTSSGSGGGGFFGGVIIPPMPKEDDEEVAKTTGIKIDLAIDLRADQRNYMEESTIHLTIDYINRSVRAASHVIITVDLPEFTKVMDLQGGTLSETGDQVSWYIERLAGKSPGQVQLTLEAEEILSQEYEVELKATIASSDDLINLVDDVSTLKFMLFSNEYGLFSHQRYIVGYPDGEFKANRYITRAEIANIFARILQLRSYVSNETLYSDVPQGKWYTDGIEAATKRGLFRGYSDGTFRPDQPITRAELTTVIFNFLQLEDRPPVTVNFSDITGHWAQNIISEVNRNRIAEGYMDGSFQPNNFLVRSEAVTMINRMLYRGPLHGAEPSYTDVDSNHWAFGDVEESTRSHEAIRNADSSEQFVREIETTLGF